MAKNIFQQYKDNKMTYERNILAGNPKGSIFDELPDDAYVIDTRKDVSKFPKLFSPSSLDYAIEYAHSKGYSDDKIYLIYECFKAHGRIYKKKGSQCDKDEDEIIQGYKDLGIELHSEYEKNQDGDA